MSIAFDAASSGTISAGTSSATFAHTVTGSDTIGHVFVAQQSDPTAVRITGVTWNGVAMTKIKTYTNTTNDSLYLWELVGVTTGDIVVSRDTTSNTGWCNAVSHTGASQTGQPDATDSANTTTTSLATSVTTVADNCWAVLGAFDSDGGTITASTNSTQRVAVTSFVKMFDNNTDITPAGSYTMTVTRATGTNDFSGVIASFAPATVSSNAILLAND